MRKSFDGRSNAWRTEFTFTLIELTVSSLPINQYWFTAQNHASLVSHLRDLEFNGSRRLRREVLLDKTPLTDLSSLASRRSNRFANLYFCVRRGQNRFTSWSTHYTMDSSNIRQYKQTVKQYILAMTDGNDCHHLG